MPTGNDSEAQLNQFVKNLSKLKSPPSPLILHTFFRHHDSFIPKYKPPPSAKFPINLRKFYRESNIKKCAAACLCSEIGIYRDNLSPIIIVIAQNSFDLSITDIAFVIYLLSSIKYYDKRFFMHIVFRVREMALWKKCTVSISSCCN